MHKIAIIISCKNEADKIEQALTSVLAQNYKNKEIVIVDDASSDNSWEVICKMINKSEEIEETTIHSDLEGIKVTALRHEFETGIAGVMVSGANIVWKDADLIGLLRAKDTYLPGKLSKSIEYMENTGDRVGIIYSDYETLIDGIPVNIYQNSFIRERLAVNADFGDAILVTKKALSVVGMVNPNKKTDALHDLWMRITERFVAIHVPEILTKESRDHAEIRT